MDSRLFCILYLPFDGNAGGIGSHMGGYDEIQTHIIVSGHMGTAFLEHFLVSHIDIAKSGCLSALCDGLDIAQGSV